MLEDKFDNEFNVNVSTKENIEYAFKNLLFYVNSSFYLDEYKEYKELIHKILVKVNSVFDMYVNGDDLLKLTDEDLEDIKLDLIDLDSETKINKSYFIEWSLMWVEAIIALRKTEMKKLGVNNE